MSHIRFFTTFAVVVPLVLNASTADAKRGGPKNPQRAQQREGKRSAKRENLALRQAQAVLGKPLNASQIKSIRTAHNARQVALHPIEQRYKVQVARALGLPLAQYEAREQAARRQTRAKSR